MKSANLYHLEYYEQNILECVDMYLSGNLKCKESLKYIKDYMKEMKGVAKTDN